MSDVNRREAVKLAAGLAVGAGVANGAAGQEKADQELEQAVQSTAQGYMLAEQVTFDTGGNPSTRHDLVLSPARSPGYTGGSVRVRLGTTKIIRAEIGDDEFTKQGGLHWECGTARGKVLFKRPGSMVLVVREMDGTVRCYALAIDLRC